MSEQTNGLRFDVYERVHLPEHVPAIEQLEEIELFPRIQVIDQGDQAVLKGQLILNGVYRGQLAGDAPLALQHEIPVEITLPMNRISRLDDILIEIDNFDVDLLSARTLNITGVLSLRGISGESSDDAETAEAWREEPFTVVHQREAYEHPPAEPYISSVPYDPSLAAVERSEEVTSESAYEESEAEETGNSAWLIEADADAESQSETDSYQSTISSAPVEYTWTASPVFESEEQYEEASPEREEREITVSSQQANGEGWLASSSPFAVTGSSYEQTDSFAEQPEQDVERIQEEQLVSDASEEAESSAVEADPWVLEKVPEPEPEKQEVRIAFAGKQPEERNSDPLGVGFSTLLQTSKREQAARQAAEDVETKQEEARSQSQGSGDEIEWKNLFLGNRAEDKEFRKIRMCIVQRDETLDAIASRYSLNPREILLYNRLEDQSVAEGQLLYIP